MILILLNEDNLNLSMKKYPMRLDNTFLDNFLINLHSLYKFYHYLSAHKQNRLPLLLRKRIAQLVEHNPHKTKYQLNYLLIANFLTKGRIKLEKMLLNILT